MKFNKWTVSLAAIGAVSLSSAIQAKADANPPNYVETATKGISISGYVDTSVNIAASGESGNKSTPIDAIPFQGGKRDGFNLDVVELNIEKDVDATPWSSGFKVSLLAGPDAVGYNSSVNSLGGGGPEGPNGTTSDFGVKQAYVELMAPVGNGLDIKVGVFDTIIGYEVFEAGSNPNFTRSWGYAMEPTEHTGVLLTYKFNDMVSASLGVANTLSSGINSRNDYHGTSSYWWKTIMGSVTVTAPQNWGFIAGSSFYLGLVNGFNGSTGVDQMNLYAGAVLNTPIKELTTGVALDYMQQQFFGWDHYDVYNIGLYATYKATDKLSFSGRGEYGWIDDKTTAGFSFDSCYYGLTGTIEYDLWANVISRVEARYEVASEEFNPATDSDFDTRCGLGLYLNLIYKF